MRPSLYVDSNNINNINIQQMNPNNINNNANNPNNANNANNIQRKRINKISNRLFILSPMVKEGKDIECSKNDFTQESYQSHP